MMKVSKQAAGIAGSAAVIVALGIGGGAYALTSNDSPSPQPTRTAVQHVVHPAADPVIPDFDDLPGSTAPAASSTPAPSPAETMPTVGQSTVNAPAPKETTVPDQPKTTEPASQPKTEAPKHPVDTAPNDVPNPYDGQGNRHGKVCGSMGDIGTVCTVTNNGTTSTYTVPPATPTSSDQR